MQEWRIDYYLYLRLLARSYGSLRCIADIVIVVPISNAYLDLGLQWLLWFMMEKMHATAFGLITRAKFAVDNCLCLNTAMCLPQKMGKGHRWSKCSSIRIHEAYQTKANTSFKVVRQRTEVDASCFVAPLTGGGKAYEPCYLRYWLPAQSQCNKFRFVCWLIFSVVMLQVEQKIKIAMSVIHFRTTTYV
jgi:hypothetical protein